MSNEENEQHLVRCEKLSNIRESRYPFPNDVQVTSSSSRFRSGVEKEAELEVEARPRYTLAGRLVSQRMMGKAAFCNLQDADGVIQLYVRRDDVGEESFKEFKTFDIGDIVEVSGYAFSTKTGEPSLYAESIRLLVKCLHPLPEKWHGLADVETRFRQRYLDLIVNERSRDIFVKRAKIISGIRRFFDSHGYVEVETPAMNTISSGASARPFVTTHNALGVELNMRIALELPLKKLVVGGIERVYELGRVFRNEGLSKRHNPEFTMIEFYQAYATYEDLMQLTEDLVVQLCDEVVSSRKITFQGRELDFSPPWKRITMIDSIHEIAGISSEHNLKTLDGARAAAKDAGQEDLLELADAGKIIFELYDRLVEDKIVDPTFITQFPKCVSPLARPNVDDPEFVDRFELIVANMELANAFSELNDAEDQRKRMEQQSEAKAAGDEEAMSLDEDFLIALEYGLPPTAGEGIGIDRLVMLLTDAPNIREVILFPTMRPQA
jgi:lysyl-tRNA synthetase class 2